MNRLALYNPWNDFESLFERSFNSLSRGVFLTEENGNEYLRLALSGFKQSDIDVTFENGVLRVEAENKKMGKYSYSANLGRLYDPEKIDAKLEDGLLEIRLERKEESKPKKIAIR